MSVGRSKPKDLCLTRDRKEYPRERITYPADPSPFAGFPLTLEEARAGTTLKRTNPSRQEKQQGFVSLHLATMESHQSEAEPIYRETTAKPHARSSSGTGMAYKASHHYQLPTLLRAVAAE